MESQFRQGDRVVLATKYWVNTPGDCDLDGSIEGLSIGSGGSVVRAVGGGTVVDVNWDDVANWESLRVNVACLAVELDENEVNEALRSISRTFQDRKKS